MHNSIALFHSSWLARKKNAATTSPGVCGFLGALVKTVLSGSGVVASGVVGSSFVGSAGVVTVP